MFSVSLIIHFIITNPQTHNTSSGSGLRSRGSSCSLVAPAPRAPSWRAWWAPPWGTPWSACSSPASPPPPPSWPASSATSPPSSASGEHYTANLLCNAFNLNQEICNSIHKDTKTSNEHKSLLALVWGSWYKFPDFTKETNMIMPLKT